MLHWAIPANAINSKVDNSCSILPAVMYEIIMCSENWFETECTSFILKTFWEHYITVWVETCSKTVWFSYSDSLHWKMTSPRETQTCLVYGMNLELRLQTSNSFFNYFSHSVLPHCWLKLFEKLPRLLLNSWKSLLHCIGFFDSLLMNALLLIHMELIWVLFLILWCSCSYMYILSMFVCIRLHLIL